MNKKSITINKETIDSFLSGHDPMERVVNLECNYNDKFVTIIYRSPSGKRLVTQEPFYPFVWAKYNACNSLCGGDRTKVKDLLSRYGIGVKKLKTTYDEISIDNERMNDGYIFQFYAHNPMSYNRFLKFFEEAGNPIYNNRNNNNNIPIAKAETRQYLAVTPTEQFMIQTGKRLFKGYEDYDELIRMEFDIETEGLDPQRHRIKQIGVRTNKDFKELIPVKNGDEISAIKRFLQIIKGIHPDVITGHNSENFDWDFIITRCEILGSPMEELSKEYFDNQSLQKRKKQTVLKLGGETEYFRQTIVPGINVTDSLHAVRRAQAIDSNLQKADLKYVTKYIKANKPNRVYIPGDKIDIMYEDLEKNYAFNDNDGDWYKITENKPLKNDYELVSGRYLIERYLEDDLYETDKVELQYNQSNFLLCKLLPTTFGRACTMGTAATWKMIMLAWSYENDIAIPAFGNAARFTGGLSRLLSVGFVDRVVKLDFNSLYPSIILTWGISTGLDISGVMLALLEYILSERERFKGLMKQATKNAKKLKIDLANFDGSEETKLKLRKEIQNWEREASANDKKQLPFKIFGNSFFGGFGAPDLFNWGDIKCAEQTTCIGRQSLRLMNKFFKGRNYQPIVMDTDGCNFQMPQIFTYTKENPYIGKGLNRNTVEGKEYIEVEADVAEFNDLYMRGKMGLGIDEYALATINFSRKNYADLIDDGNGNEKIKLVGNTIKSKKMPGYIEKFLKKGIEMLLRNQGQKFLEEYYSYIEKIYNYQIPLRDIASRGKIKRSVDDYKKDMKTITKAGRTKSRQAWYELVLKDDVKVDVGDTIYYINTGKTKSHADVKKTTHYFKLDENKEKIDITKELTKEWKEIRKNKTDGFGVNFQTLTEYANLKGYIIEEEIILNSMLLSRDIIESETETFCGEDSEYNAPKYISQFNSRIKPLLVCFDKKIRNNILITNPSDGKYYTEEEAKLTFGQPNETKDQDTYEQLMIPEDKEIKFWLSVNLIPPFIEECGIEWDELVKDYHVRMAQIKELNIENTINRYNQVIDELTSQEVNSFKDTGNLPNKIFELIREDPTSNNFLHKDYDIIIGNILDILEKDFSMDADRKIEDNENVLDDINNEYYKNYKYPIIPFVDDEDDEDNESDE